MSDFVKLNISNSQTEAISFEQKFPLDITIGNLKLKLEILTGGCASSMKVELYSGQNLLAKLDDNDAPLGRYSPKDSDRLHVIDNFMYLNETVEKFELTEEQYKEKQDTVLNFLKSNNLGKFSPAEMKRIEEKKQQNAEEEQKRVELAVVGSRCQVSVKGQPTRVGTVMYNGPLDDKKGTFIGVKFDEPLGVNDGSLNGKQYFECPPKYGSFVAPLTVKVGDFPPASDGLDDLDEM